MSRNPSAAITRDDAAVNESSPHAVTLPRQDLADLAAMLARVEALVTADATPEPNGSDPIERIADIAFVLHERDVEASLCDALDAAVREISAAGARKEDRARRARQAAEVLRELSQRVSDMIALSQMQHGGPLGAAHRIEGDLPQGTLSRGGSLPSPAPAVALASDPQRETNVVAAPPSEPVERTEPVQRTKSTGRQGAAALNVAEGAVRQRSSTAPETLSVAPMAAADPFLDEDLLPPTTASETAVSNKPLDEISSSEAPSPSPSSASQRKESPLPLNPEDDPGDLFEPAEGMPPPAAPEPAIKTAAVLFAQESGLAPVPERRNAAALTAAEAGGSGAESSSESYNPPRPLRFPTAAAALSVPHQEPADPLAPVRALSEEEMIALFS